MTTRIKVCGLTRPEDVVLATELGACAVGFVLTESPRRVDVAGAASLAATSRKSTREPAPLTVLVFATEDAAVMAQSLVRARADAVQLSAGRDGPSVAMLRLALEQAGVSGATVIAAADTPDALDADLVLRDRRVAGKYGGSGSTLDWTRLAADHGLDRERLVLAGGLSPENVGQAIATVRPFAVDASSRLESRPGVKDATALRAFFAAVEAADVPAGLLPDDTLAGGSAP